METSTQNVALTFGSEVNPTIGIDSDVKRGVNIWQRRSVFDLKFSTLRERLRVIAILLGYFLVEIQLVVDRGLNDQESILQPRPPGATGVAPGLLCKVHRLQLDCHQHSAFYLQATASERVFRRSNCTRTRAPFVIYYLLLFRVDREAQVVTNPRSFVLHPGALSSTPELCPPTRSFCPPTPFVIYYLLLFPDYREAHVVTSSLEIP